MYLPGISSKLVACSSLAWFPNPLAAGSQMGILSTHHALELFFLHSFSTQTLKWYSVTSRQTPYTLTSAGRISIFYFFHLKLERIFNRQYAIQLKIVFLSILICGPGIECQKSNFCNDAVRERTYLPFSISDKLLHY